MRSITSNIVIMHMTTVVNYEELENNPPSIPFAIGDPEQRKALLDNAKHGAVYYDMYRDIIHISVMCICEGHVLNGKTVHLMYCAGQEQSVVRYNPSPSTQCVCYNTQEDLLVGLRDLLSVIASCEPGTPAIEAIPVLAGWKINTEIWPFVVNKLLANNLPIHSWWKSDPMARFNTIPGLLDISNIYSQGMSMNIRRLPTLPDVLSYWGIGSGYDEPIDIVGTVCTAPAVAAAKIETYLSGMYELIKRYYA